MNHYYAVFQVHKASTNTRHKMEAHVYARTIEECDLILKKKVNTDEVSFLHLIERSLLPNRSWKVGGVRSQLSAHVDSINDYVEFQLNESFTEFLALYREQLRDLPTNTATRWLTQERPLMMSDVQIFILADFTGEAFDSLKKRMLTEYMAKFIMHTMEEQGRSYVQAHFPRNALIAALRGDLQHLEAAKNIPGFGAELPLQAGELLYYVDVNSATSSEPFLYCDDSKFCKLSVRSRARLCAQHEGFIDIFKAMNLSYISKKLVAQGRV